jgi:uncharacterized repeat protein (TIGR03803 family)
MVLGRARLASFAALPFAGTIFFAAAADAGSITTLYIFHGAYDGGNPHGQLLDVNGLFYGTAEAGGADDQGVVFTIDPISGKETVVRSFKGGNDGSQPIGSLVPLNGLLYGVTQGGGPGGDGTLFSIYPPTGAEKIVHSFAGDSDGFQPSGGPIAVNGILYGVTWAGGPDEGGTVYAINPHSKKERILFALGGTGTGQNPVGSLLYYNGALYGVTSNGGAKKREKFGTIFTVALSGGGKTLYSFDQPGSDTDGSNPWSGLVLDGGLFYGTTYSGGSDACGTIYSFDPSSNAETPVYNFNCQYFGGFPEPTLSVDGGKLYGATSFGAGSGCGGSGCGTIYAFDPTLDKVTVLYSFTTGQNGGNPEAELVASGGTLLGTTFDAGISDEGSVFELSE